MPELQFDVSRARDDAQRVLIEARFGVVVEDPIEFRVFAFFSLTYQLDDTSNPDDTDLVHVAHWNAVINA